MDELGMDELVEATALYSSLVGEHFDLIGPMLGGETGAIEIRRRDGARFVLKWDRDPASKERRRVAVDIARRLGAEAGWPVPSFDLAENDTWLFVRQEHMPGVAVSRLTHRLVDQLLELSAKSRGLVDPSEDDGSWPRDLLSTLTDGGVGYCNHEPLRQYSSASLRLIERVEDIGQDLAAGHISLDDFGGLDLIHWDLHPGNILQLDGSVSAIVDLDHAKVGNSGFDLVTLALASLVTDSDPGVPARLMEVVEREVGLALRQACVAHMLLRMVNWNIRRRRPAAADFWLDRWPELLI